MREILFRGKRKDTKRMVYGYLFMAINAKKEKEPCIWLEHGQSVAVIPETVGQFTGLTDKNGKKIFEGDAVMFNGVKEYPMQIIWDDDIARFSFDDLTFNYAQDMDKQYADVCEVIGNIHDNPELLELKR